MKKSILLLATLMSSSLMARPDFSTGSEVICQAQFIGAIYSERTNNCHFVTVTGCSNPLPYSSIEECLLDNDHDHGHDNDDDLAGDGD
ncbi:MAG: hypothetical protein HRU19_26615 [Pseudobacteriovorax sp.]|nr:hypothetical protein [Pseudobacteriovorax sp.]